LYRMILLNENLMLGTLRQSVPGPLIMLLAFLTLILVWQNHFVYFFIIFVLFILFSSFPPFPFSSFSLNPCLFVLVFQFLGFLPNFQSWKNSYLIREN
jgi:hypothetical protein